MQWNLRMKSAERGIWKSTQLRRLLGDAGLEMSAGKMSALWTGPPTSIRLDDLEIICSVLECEPTDLLVVEPERVLARRPKQTKASEATRSAPTVAPRLGSRRSTPPV